MHAGSGTPEPLTPQNNDTVIRVAVIDDQAMVRAGFGALLNAQPDITVIGSAADGEAGVHLVTETVPDVVLMDIRMPRMDGLAATRAIQAASLQPRPRVIMLTTFDADEYVFEALRAGASGFILKDATAEALIDAVRVVAAGDALLSPSVTRRLIADYASRPVAGITAVPAAVTADPAVASAVESPASQLTALTERELDIMRHIATGASNAEIAAELFLAEQTVKTHVSRVLAKLGLRDRTQVVVAAYETGLVQPGG